MCALRQKTSFWSPWNPLVTSFTSHIPQNKHLMTINQQHPLKDPCTHNYGYRIWTRRVRASRLPSTPPAFLQDSLFTPTSLVQMNWRRSAFPTALALKYKCFAERELKPSNKVRYNGETDVSDATWNDNFIISNWTCSRLVVVDRR